MSDQHLISPHNITAESHIKVMKVRKIETIDRKWFAWLRNKQTNKKNKLDEVRNRKEDMKFF